MTKIESKLKQKQEKVLIKNLYLRRPDAILFDWENTIVRRKSHSYSIQREMLFEITDMKIVKLLELLKKCNIYTGVVSNKNSSSLNNEIQKLGFKKFFNKVLGSDCSPEPKPSVEMMIRAIDDSEIEFGENVWMIGDSDVDIEFAKMSLATGILFCNEGSDVNKNDEKFIKNLKIHSFQEIIDLVEYFYNEGSAP